MAVVTFDIDDFRARYPRFEEVTDTQLEMYFQFAENIVDNTENSIVPYDPPDVMTRLVIMYALICHFATLDLRDPTGGMVGAISSATEGSVSVGYSGLNTTESPGAAWWNQTQCGALAWRMLVPYMQGGRAYRGCFR